MLKVQAEELADVVVLRLKGHIVRGPETATLRGAVLSHAEVSIVALDLSQVEVIDAGGLSALLELREWTRANGIEFKLVNPSKLVHRLFAITRLDSVFDISLQENALSAGEADMAPAIVAASLGPMEHRA